MMKDTMDENFWKITKNIKPRIHCLITPNRKNKKYSRKQTKQNKNTFTEGKKINDKNLKIWRKKKILFFKVQNLYKQMVSSLQ